VENQTYLNVWSCDCSNGYVSNLTIAPNAKNDCLIIYDYIQAIEVPERVVHRTTVYRYYTNATNITYLNQTIVNLTTSYEVLYRYYSNLSQKLMTKVQVLESEKQTYQNLVNYLKGLINRQNATMEELGQEIEKLAEERQELERRWLLSIAVLVFFLVLSSMVFLVKLKRKNQQIGKLLVAFRKRE